MSSTPKTSSLETLRGLDVAPRSVTSASGAELGIARTDDGERLVAMAPKGSLFFGDLEGKIQGHHDGRTFLLGPLSTHNAAALREALPWLRPRLLGLQTSTGFGDRLGLATPGHVRALRTVGGDIAPIFAQQSIREMQRTGRTPQEVIDDATWGVFAEGWREGFGADADHLKTFEDVDACVAAGYTFFTFDPGEWVDDQAEGVDARTLRGALDGLPWEELEDNFEDLKRRYPERLTTEGCEVTLGGEALARAAVKYGRGVAHVASMYRYLDEAMGGRPFEVEVSVDETETPTTHAQHAYVAGELSRLGVRFVSLAPRYVGRFEKGVDYIGDIGVFERDFAVHAALARAASCSGPYKLSLHSGSDKLSIYEPAVRQARGLVHLKTAGTSYLEALRTVAVLDPALFREVYAFARERYGEDRLSYHVSASLRSATPPEECTDDELAGLLEQFDEREILHVTFGSVLTEARLRGRLFALLRAHPEDYATSLESHFVKHLRPFKQGD
jgi:tagaturonate epimerase